MVQNYYPKHYRRIKRCRSINTAITEDIIFFEILPRLPVKSLIRFKSVCKSWSSLMSNPSFVAAHLERSRKSPKLTILPLFSDNQRSINLYSYDGRGGHSASFLFGKKWSKVHDYLEPLHHSNGLLLSCTSNQLLLCNPSTRDFTTLPKGSHNALTYPMSVLRAGFGFVPGTGIYKVAQYFYRSFNYQKKTSSMGFEVFTIGIDSSWRISTKDPPYPVKILSPAVSAGEAIYFEIDNDLHTSSPELILSFDIRDENFKVIPFPSCFKSSYEAYMLTDLEDSPLSYYLTELDGSLCSVIYCLQENKYEIWMYKDCSGHTWVHPFTVKFPNPPQFFSFIAVRDGKLLLEIDDGEDKLAWFDPESNSFETMVRIAKDVAYRHRRFVSYFGENCLFQVVSYVESLVAVKPRRLSYSC